MHTLVKHTIKGQSLCLSPDRCIFWEEQQSLIVSDLHFGKTGHFRKSGIAVPQTVYKEDMQRLVNLLQFFKPKQMIVVGDFFHSRENKELDFFLKWRADFESLDIILVKGNHDILQAKWYERANITMVDDCLHIGPFAFAHDLNACTPDKAAYLFSGHFHPAIYLSGAGRQSITLPCFYFTKQYAILPAFSKFSGVALVDPSEGDAIYAIADNKLIPMKEKSTIKNQRSKV